MLSDQISDTLFINIKMKALENNLKNGVLKDEYSLKLYNELDYDFSKFPDRGLSRMGVALRAKYFDDELSKFIASNPNCVVVFVGSGLDTRFFRINGESLEAKFYELDLDDVILLRKQVLPSPKVEYIKSSMFETKWMDELKDKHKNQQFFFCIEGVLMYFEESLVKELFINLATRFKGVILCDILNVWMSQNSAKHDVIKDMEAKFKFGLEELKDIEKWHKNIKLTKSIPVMKVDKKRVPFWINLLLLVPKFANATRLVTFKLKS